MLALGLTGPAEAQSLQAKQAAQRSVAPTQTQHGPEVWYVDASYPQAGKGTLFEPYRSLATALAAPGLGPGDQVLVAPGTYAGPVVAPSFGVRVRATEGPQATRIDGQFSGPALVLAGTDGVPFVLEGFTVENGSGAPAPPIFSAGGGLQATSAVFELRGCAIERNDAFWGGGVFALDSVGRLVDCSISMNTNTGFGARGAGVLVDGGSLAIEDCTVALNVSGDFFAPGHGGGVYAQGGVDLDVLDTLIEFNVAELGGGGTFGDGDYVGCTLRGNTGQFGGGANATAGTVFTDCLIELNVADSVGGTSHFGGGVWGPATLERCTVADNVAWGGSAGVEGGLLLDCVVRDNVAVPGFGGVNSLAGGVQRGIVLSSTLVGNEAYGGDLYTALGGGASESTLIDCDVDSNDAGPGPADGGGGVYSCDVRRSRLFGNEASGPGGGAYLGTLRHCLVYDNEAEAGGGAADADLRHCTLDDNRAAVGGGLYVSSGVSLTVKNSILYWNVPDEIVTGGGATWQVEYCDVLGGVPGGLPGVGNIDADPLFWDRAQRDYHLLPASPCIDAGDPLSAPDPDGSTTDMGALWGDPEYRPDATTGLGIGIKP